MTMFIRALLVIASVCGALTFGRVHGQSLQERLEDDDLVAPFDAHRRAVDAAVGVYSGDDALDDHEIDD